MEKSKSHKANLAINKTNTKALKVAEPEVPYPSVKSTSLLKDFNYKDFKKIADNVPFSIKEWADILHISERTLQRYSKANSNFTFSVVDRILQIDKVIKKGIHVFGSLNKFNLWIRDNPYMLEGRLSLQSLGSIDGCNMIMIQLGRIEHGILA
ncbi:MAG: hypothetical protein H0W12_02860 [Chitinophagaceae bacterium]|nr:hypothetical protein [Chitinophagaceae bacterium]